MTAAVTKPEWGEDETKYVLYKGWITRRWFVQFPGGDISDGPGFSTFEEARKFVSSMLTSYPAGYPELGG